MRTGKIARLPHGTRRDLNLRLDDNVPGPRIVKWLNSLPAVKKILRDLFHGTPITEQNLSEWRRGGYAEWQIRREFLTDLRESAQDAADIEEITPFLADRASRLLTARIMVTLTKWNGDPDDPAFTKLKSLSTLVRSLTALQRGEHQSARLKMDQHAFDLACHARQSLDPDDPATEPVRTPSVQKWSHRFRTPPPDPNSDPETEALITYLHNGLSGPRKKPTRTKPLTPEMISNLLAPSPTYSNQAGPTPTPTPTLTHTPPPNPPAPSEPAAPDILCPHSFTSNKYEDPAPSDPDSTIHDSTIIAPTSPPPMSLEEAQRILLLHEPGDPIPPPPRVPITSSGLPYHEIIRRQEYHTHPDPSPPPPKSLMPYRY